MSETDSDLRRRAAWLLGMLVLVAVLLVVLMTLVIGGGGDGPKAGSHTGPLDSVVNQGGSSSRTSSSSSGQSSSSSSGSPSSPTPTPGATSCPTPAVCVLDGDVGNGIAAINTYRTQHGQPAVAGAVSPQAQTCARNNGNGCTGGWAETELATPDGPAAVQKILPFGKLLDPNLKNFEVGWAFDPGAKLYYFAIIRND